MHQEQMDATFESLGLSAKALEALARAGFLRPTPIQARAIPPALEGKDVIGCAATGTGKSAAFALPLLEKISGKAGTRALILAPTRELALQIAEVIEMLGRSRRVRCAVLIGGVSLESQLRALSHRPEVLVATPGRLVDHLQQGSVQLKDIEILVLDEADRMLDMGFRPQLTRILARVPRERQTLLFSATLSREVFDFVRSANLKDPVRVEVSPSGTTAQKAEQGAYLVPQGEKLALLLTLLEQEEKSTLVFTRTKRRADKVARVIERAGHATARIHADRSQSQRRHALEGFRKGKFRVLVATDIAARGLDVEDIGHVVNFDLPHLAEDYVHRIGRTARASASGRASALVAPEERGLLGDIERFTRQSIPRLPVDRTAEAFLREMQRSAKQNSDPGPRQPGFGISSRPEGQPPGRHARTHRNKPKAAHAAVSSPSGRIPTSGRWQPRRHG
jgi:ATP-dependent RNA helicase RhlE